MPAIAAMTQFLSEHASNSVLQVAGSLYSDYRKAANQGNGIVLFKNDCRYGVTVFAHNAGEPVKRETMFTCFIAPGKVGQVDLPNPLPLVSSLDFCLFVNK